MNGPKTYVLYHGNCYDGFGAALAAWMLFNREGINAEYHPVLYGKPYPSMEPLSDVFILDFSYPAAELLKLAKDKLTVVVLDHHKTAQKDLSVEAWMEALGNPELRPSGRKDDGWIEVQNIRIKFDMAKSGAVLAWEYFHQNQPVPRFFQYLQDRDLWAFKLPHSKPISMWVRTLPWDFGVWEYEVRNMESSHGQREIVSAGVACEKLVNQMVDTMCDNARMMLFDLTQIRPVVCAATSPEVFDGQFLVPTANATVFFSEVGERLLERYPQAKFSAYYLERGDGILQFGLRSRSDFDCSAIAKAFGGGGHKQSSGFVVDVSNRILI